MFLFPRLSKICGKVISSLTGLQTQPFRPERTDLQLTALSKVKGQWHEMFLFPRLSKICGKVISSLTGLQTQPFRPQRTDLQLTALSNLMEQ
jgi:hypothetical protein